MLKDIVTLIRNVLCLGVFFYNGHPVRQVDVVRTVVQTKERDAFYNYGGKKSLFLLALTSLLILVTFRT